MAKDKQHGFFSWLSLNKNSETQKRYDHPVKLLESQEVKIQEELATNLVSNPDTNGDTSKGLHNKPISELFMPNLSALTQLQKAAKEIADPDEKPPPIQAKYVETGTEELMGVVRITGQVTPPEPVIVQHQTHPTNKRFFTQLKHSLLKTKETLGFGFIGLFRGKRIDKELFDDLEQKLLTADIGIEATRKIITTLSQHASRKQLTDAEALYGKLKAVMSDILTNADKPLDINDKPPYVILMVGVNGVGKTTTIGKLARKFQVEGKSVMLAAGDTFRAGAIEQLQVWGTLNRIPVVAQHTGADSASVIFEALQTARAGGVELLIADTAGRLQNNTNLMAELKKIVRIMRKFDDQAPHEVMLVLDACAGQNAVSQAKLFNEAIKLTGITLTKLDGTAKGGVIFTIADQFRIPIRYIGIGESIEDLRPFESAVFIEALFSKPSNTGDAFE
ncbi:Signal recognition particle receptor FtsY [Serratia symbiotica]|nr:Signal recognition particle receptor FtsY [Serratia symbiotica]